MTRPTRCARSDEGSSLVLALVFITSIGLVVGALLSYAGAGFRSHQTTLLASQAATDASGALQAAVNDVRNSEYFNDASNPGTTCLPHGTEETYPDLSAGGEQVTVTCAPDSASGAAAGLVVVNNSNRPPLAVLTLATGSEVGLTNAKNYPLKIKGSVYSNSGMRSDVAGSPCSATWPPPSSATNCTGVFVQGPNSNPSNVDLRAENGCAGTFVVPDSTRKNCSTAHVSPAGNDPALTYPTAYAQPTTGITPVALPTCSGNPVTFSPGYYDDATALSALMNGSGPCRNKTFWFPPGRYYFDFRDEELGLGSNVWTFNDATSVLVAGQKNGWTTTTDATNMPGACISPLTDETAQGVQFVFGGSSRLFLDKGSAELCGSYYNDRPALVLYGAKADTATAPQSATLLPTTLVSSGNPSFAPVTPATLLHAADDVTTSTTAQPVTKGKAATLGVTTFSGLSSAVPAKATLDDLKVTVRHREVGANAGTTVQLKVTPNRSGAPTITKNLTVSSTMTSQEVDLTADLANEVYRYGLPASPAPFTAQLVVSADNANSQSIVADVDRLTVAASWRALVFRQQGGCVAAVGGCSVVATSPTHTEEFYVQGTAYVPRAKLSIELNSPATAQVFRAGLVARSVYLNVRPSNDYAGPLIELPDNSFGPTPLKVYLTAWTCPTGSCASPASSANGWTRRGRALVEYTDPGTYPVSGDRGVKVLSWQIGR